MDGPPAHSGGASTSARHQPATDTGTDTHTHTDTQAAATEPPPRPAHPTGTRRHAAPAHAAPNRPVPAVASRGGSRWRREGFARRLAGALRPRRPAWRVRRKFVAVMVVPTLAFVGVAGLNIAGSVRTANSLHEGTRLAELARHVIALTHELQLERDLTAGYLASRHRLGLGTLLAQRRDVDAAAARYRSYAVSLRGQYGSPIEARLGATLGGLLDLANLRDAVTADSLTERAVFDQYSDTIDLLLDLDRGISRRFDDETLRQSLLVFNDLSQAKEATARVRGYLYAVAYEGSWGFGEFQDFADLRGARRTAFGRFTADAGARQRARYAELVRGQAVLVTSRIEDAAVRRELAPTLGIDPQQWLAASTTELEQMRTVESELLAEAAGHSRALSTAAQHRVASTIGVIGLILLAGALISLVVAQSLVRPLQRLRTNALEVAEHRLPEVVARLRDADEAVAAAEAGPAPAAAGDEIGELAQAFDAVHREALRLAREQALLRRNISTMFVNLSRRSQVLAERQLQFIDELETHEDDPVHLANLFTLDHQATRMRRFAESLLVLAGGEFSRRWASPKVLADVMRAAASEVEQYQRIDIMSATHVAVTGVAVNDLVHLVAELLENATTFSPRTTTVQAKGHAIRAGKEALIEIQDFGVGMSAHDLAEANRRLAEPAGLDVAVSQQMGLHVVSRLAARHGITVELRSSDAGGLTASVRLPPQVITVPDADSASGGSGDERGGQLSAAGLPVRRPGSSAGAALATRPAVHSVARPIEQVAGAPLPRRRPSQAPPAAPTPPAPTPVTRSQPPLSPAVPPQAPSHLVPASATALARPEDILGPRVPAAPAEDEGTPLFDEMASAWFHDRRLSPVAPGGARRGEPDVPAAPRWESPADAGWAAAEQASAPSDAAETAAGLPLRVPGAHRVPGSVTPSPRSRPAPSWDPHPEQVRGVLSDLYRGVSQGRAEPEPDGGEAAP